MEELHLVACGPERAKVRMFMVPFQLPCFYLASLSLLEELLRQTGVTALVVRQGKHYLGH